MLGLNQSLCRSGVFYQLSFRKFFFFSFHLSICKISTGSKAGLIDIFKTFSFLLIAFKQVRDNITDSEVYSICMQDHFNL